MPCCKRVFNPMLYLTINSECLNFHSSFHLIKVDICKLEWNQKFKRYRVEMKSVGLTLFDLLLLHWRWMTEIFFISKCVKYFRIRPESLHSPMAQLVEHLTRDQRVASLRLTAPKLLCCSLDQDTLFTA